MSTGKKILGTFLEEFPEELAHNVTPATLDGQLQERDELQQAVVASNAAEDASRRTWTQARQLMNECFSKSWILPNECSRATHR